jgi:SEC-C motif-containing protein
MCYCNNPASFDDCCRQIINGVKTASSAEQLMRSRYSAYCTKEAEYILNTYALSQRSMHSIADILEFANEVNFIKLDIIHIHNDSEYDYVEFKAHYLVGDKHYQLHEQSRFILENESWKYLDGNLYDSPESKIGRNDMCPCKSGKKFKKCHG